MTFHRECLTRNCHGLCTSIHGSNGKIIKWWCVKCGTESLSKLKESERDPTI